LEGVNEFPPFGLVSSVGEDPDEISVFYKQRIYLERLLITECIEIKNFNLIFMAKVERKNYKGAHHEK